MAAELLVDETGPDLLRVVGEIDTHTAPTLAERLADIPATRHSASTSPARASSRPQVSPCCSLLQNDSKPVVDRSASSVRVRRCSDCLSCQASPAGCRSPTSSATTTDRPFSVCRRSSALSAATIRSRGPEHPTRPALASTGSSGPRSLATSLAGSVPRPPPSGRSPGRRCDRSRWRRVR